MIYPASTYGNPLILAEGGKKKKKKNREINFQDIVPETGNKNLNRKYLKTGLHVKLNRDCVW